jgi:hypothetical protein
MPQYATAQESFEQMWWRLQQNAIKSQAVQQQAASPMGVAEWILVVGGLALLVYLIVIWASANSSATSRPAPSHPRRRLSQPPERPATEQPMPAPLAAQAVPLGNIRFHCPSCQKLLEAPPATKCACPVCGQRVLVPRPPATNKTVLGILPHIE